VVESARVRMAEWGGDAKEGVQEAMGSAREAVGGVTSSAESVAKATSTKDEL